MDLHDHALEVLLGGSRPNFWTDGIQDTINVLITNTMSSIVEASNSEDENPNTEIKEQLQELRDKLPRAIEKHMLTKYDQVKKIYTAYHDALKRIRTGIDHEINLMLHGQFQPPDISQQKRLQGLHVRFHRNQIKALNEVMQVHATTNEFRDHVKLFLDKSKTTIQNSKHIESLLQKCLKTGSPQSFMEKTSQYVENPSICQTYLLECDESLYDEILQIIGVDNEPGNTRGCGAVELQRFVHVVSPELLAQWQTMWQSSREDELVEELRKHVLEVRSIPRLWLIFHREDESEQHIDSLDDEDTDESTDA